MKITNIKVGKLLEYKDGLRSDEHMKNCSTCAYPTECNGIFTCNCGDSDMYEKQVDGYTTCDCWEEN